MNSGVDRNSDPTPCQQRDQTYSLYGLSVASNILFPELISVHHSSNPDCYFEVLEPTVAIPMVSTWFHRCYSPSGKLWRSCAKQGDSYLLRFHNLADFHFSRSGDRISCYPVPNIPEETIRHLVLDQVIPLWLNVRGQELLHASSLLTPHGACGLLGDTGAGKSTLAASLMAAGCTILGDDCLPLAEMNGRVVAIPGYSGLRLWPSSAEALFGGANSFPVVSHYNQKRRVTIDRSGLPEPRPLVAIFVLASPESSDTPKIERLTAVDALKELLQHCFRLDVTDCEMLRRQFKFFGRLISQTAVHRLTYPRDFSVLPTVGRLVLDSLAVLEPIVQSDR